MLSSSYGISHSLSEIEVCRAASQELDESSTESWLSNLYAVPADPDDPEGKTKIILSEANLFVLNLKQKWYFEEDGNFHLFAFEFVMYFLFFLPKSN